MQVVSNHAHHRNNQMKDQRTDEELNRVIAEWMGPRQFLLIKHRLYWGPNRSGYVQHIALAGRYSDEESKKLESVHGEPDDVTRVEAPIPNYCTDLNAIHEAENKWCDQDLPDDASHPLYRLADTLYGVCVPRDNQPFRATARQRAEALVKVIEAKGGE